MANFIKKTSKVERRQIAVSYFIVGILLMVESIHPVMLATGIVMVVSAFVFAFKK